MKNVILNFIKKYIYLIILILVTFLVYKNWFTDSLLIAHDLPIIYEEMFRNYTLIPNIWHIERNAGFGENSASLLWTFQFFATPITIFGTYFKFPWLLIERIAFFYPFLFFSLFNSAFIFNKLFNNLKFSLISAIIYTTNSYVLILISGGQIELGISYAFFPLVIYLCIKLVNYLFSYASLKNLLINSLFIGIIMGIYISIELRYAYVAFLAVFVYFIFNLILEFSSRKYEFIKNKTLIINTIIFTFLIPLLVIILINSYWLIPTLLTQSVYKPDLGNVSVEDSLAYFSFAKLEHSISLLHPNWPENLFGKVLNMQFEFLTIPIIAFASLLFIHNRTNKLKSIKANLLTTSIENSKYIVFFTILGLIGVFLSKGFNSPFGNLYVLLFKNVPGFIMFRDPTKWYILIALSYSLLIPFTLLKISSLVLMKIENIKNFNIFLKNKILEDILIILFLFIWLFTIRHAILGQLGGTFKYQNIPIEYEQLKTYLNNQNYFYRTLWVPSTQRYGYFTNQHPQINAKEFFKVNDVKSVIDILKKEETKILLQKSSVKYIVIPLDTNGEIFVSDRKYDQTQYNYAINQLNDITWLKPIDSFGKILLYELDNPKDRFWFTNEDQQLNWKSINATEYLIKTNYKTKDYKLIFAESFDPNWKAYINGKIVNTDIYDKRFNSFNIPAGVSELKVIYTAQKWANLGTLISGISLVIFTSLILYIKYFIKDRK